MCSKCKIEKSIDQFYTNKTSKDGLQGFCKSCGCLATKNWRENNKDKIKQHRKNYCEVNKDKMSGYNKNYYEANQDKIKQLHKDWGKNNRDRANLILKKHREKYKELCLCIHCGSQLMENNKLLCEKCWFKACSRKNLGSSKHWEHLKTLFEQQNHKCAYTGLDLILGINASVDHIKPRKKYPELAIDPNNVCWCDRSINRSKSDRELGEFKKELDKLVFYDNQAIY